MSLIIIQQETLKNIAVVTLKNNKGNISHETIGDLIIIKSNNEVVGLNIKNFKKYFSFKEGAHTINKEQIEAIEKLGFKIENSDSMFVVGKILKKEIHPKSDNLFILKVLTTKELQIITNDKNIQEGDRVIVAKVGATLPSGMTIVHSKIIGIDSEGMLCGGETLGKEKTNGVWKVDLPEGQPFIL